ncbi:hypothetical protein [Streptomyces longwoodensis]|uniref:hypothetical protein n=1 Tax=Streptomyces longwoodensis TaxID=68231 RepID=UPI0033CB0CFB
MTNDKMPEASASARVHAERIRAGEKTAGRAGAAAGKSTAELYAERILPGYRADEAARERAQMGELRARGVVSADDVPEDDEEFEDQYEEEPAEDDDGEERPPTTAELYAERERERQQAEHAANVRAQTGAVGTMGRAVWPQYPVRVQAPHRYADRWQKPAS